MHKTYINVWLFALYGWMLLETYGIFRFSSFTNRQIEELLPKIQSCMSRTEAGLARIIQIDPFRFWSTDPTEMAAQEKGKPVPRQVMIHVTAKSGQEAEAFLRTAYRELNKIPCYGCIVPKIYEMKR